MKVERKAQKISEILALQKDKHKMLWSVLPRDPIAIAVKSFLNKFFPSALL